MKKSKETTTKNKLSTTNNFFTIYLPIFATLKIKK